MTNSTSAANTASSTTTNTASNPTGPSPRFVPIDHIDGAPLAADDPRVPFARAVATARAVVAELTGDDAGNSTPCPDWTSKEVAGHIVAVMDRVVALPTGVSVDDMALVRDDLALDELGPALATAAHAAQQAWTDDALQKMVNVPWGTIPGFVAMAVYASELLIHTWDLATSIGVEPQWHEPDVAAALQAVQMGIPAEPRGFEGMPFYAVVPLAEDAPTIHQLVAWVGRVPR